MIGDGEKIEKFRSMIFEYDKSFRFSTIVGESLLDFSEAFAGCQGTRLM